MLGNFFFSSTGEAAYEIEQSLRIAKQSYLYYTPSSSGNRTTWTYSCWVKRGTTDQAIDTILHANANYGNDWTSDSLQFHTSNFGIQIYCRRSDTNSVSAYTTEKYRDLSAWYHIVAVWDSNNGTATDRFRYYINGVRQTFTWNLTPSSGFTSIINNSSYVHRIGQGASQNSEKYMAECHFVEGTAVTDALDFGEYNDQGVWVPIEYTGSYGSGGFYLKFDPSATNGVGHDHSGNGNHWSAQNIVTSGTGTDVMSDTPTTNWCTLNPLVSQNGSYSEGNLVFNRVTADYQGSRGTMAIPSSGKWYWETTSTAQDTAAASWVAVGMATAAVPLTSFAGNTAGSIYYGDRNDSLSRITNGTTVVSQGATTNFVQGDILQCAYDADTGKFWFGLNNSWWDSSVGTTGNPSAGTNQTLTAAAGEYFPIVQFGDSYSNVLTVNFGQRDFAYTPPTDFLPLNTSNLPSPDIADGSEYFNTVLYNGTASSQSITGVGFQPDWTWIKARGASSDHRLYDVIRGATKELYSNLTNAEATDTAQLTSFDSDGFSVGSGSGVNDSAAGGYVAWNWLAGNGTSSNTAGSITSTVSVNATAGFSIVSYTGNNTAGATVGHGLGVAPAFIITKNRDNSSAYWGTFHHSLGTSKKLYLNDAQYADTMSNWLGVSSTLITWNQTNANNVNENGSDFICYCFAEVEGYSKFGIYSGNGNANGPFVYCGFKPQWILLKSSSNGSWELYDTVRDTYNQAEKTLEPNGTAVEGSGYPIDILSNGFKVRTSNSQINYSSYDYVFAAFASSPFGGSGVSPATAR